jgi:hypothetical protein
MTEFALLIMTSANRVYGQDASRLALAELALIAPSFNHAPDDCHLQTLGGVEYLPFQMDELDGHDRFILSNLSATYALFEVLGGTSGGALKPQGSSASRSSIPT